MKTEGIEFVSPLPFVVCVQRMQKFGAGMLFQKDNTSIRLREFSWVDPAEDKTGFRLQAISWGGRNTLPNHAYLDENGELAGIPEGTHVRLNIQAGFPTSLGERLYVLGWDLLVFFPVAVFLYRAYRTPSSESLGALGLVILLPVLNFFFCSGGIHGPGKACFPTG